MPTTTRGSDCARLTMLRTMTARWLMAQNLKNSARSPSLSMVLASSGSARMVSFARCSSSTPAARRQ